MAADKSDNAARLTHGRHCPCSSCARQNWAEPGLAPCGMHGLSCPPIYAPDSVPRPGTPLFDRAVSVVYSERFDHLTREARDMIASDFE